jgi:NADPH:quinone reductase-like Zn-dependent oxidoreductase
VRRVLARGKAGYAPIMVKAFGYNSNGGPDVHEFLDLEMPSPMAGELLVEVRTAGVNPVDWKIRSGMMGPANPSDLPAVLGSEVSGVVREVGQDVEGFAVNDEVFGSVAPGSGGYAEYTLVTASAAAHKPPQVSFNDAATLPVAAATAYDGVTQLALKEGHRNKLITAGDPVTATELGGHMIERDRTHRVLEIVAALVAEDKLDPHIEDIRPLDEAAEAIAAVEVGHAKGKVVIEVSS